MADRYHWLYDDVSARVGTRTPGIQAAIRDLTPGARVLDAACGLGFDALSLHRRGFLVTASDASPAMVEQCRARLAAAGVDVPVTTCTWTDLPDRFGAEFDVVLCTGNSLAHAPSARERRAALRGFTAVLAPGGLLILDTQDWEILHGRGHHRDDDPLVVERDGHRATRSFDWQVPERFGDPIRLALTVTVDGEPVVGRPVTFCPFTAEALVADLEACGFVDSEVVQNPGDDRYVVTARRSNGVTPRE